MVNNQIPIPPVKPDLVELHKHIIDMNNWVKNMFLNGTQATHLSSSQLTAMTTANDLTQAGKVFFNTDTSKTQKSTIVAGNLTITDF